VNQLSLIPNRRERFDGEAFGKRGEERTGRRSESMCDRVAALLKSRPGEWIDGREFAAAAGYAGWRTPISECRKAAVQLGHSQPAVPARLVHRL
jgi:hypothetical protein